MTTMTAYDQRLADHLTRIARVNQQGWMRQASPLTRFAPTPRNATVLASIRQRIGVVIVRAGERLQGSSAGRVADRAAV
jgi:hypothetical protein